MSDVVSRDRKLIIIKWSIDGMAYWKAYEVNRIDWIDVIQIKENK